VTLRKAIEAALPFVEKSFTDRPLIEARLRMTIGTSFWHLGEHKKAESQFQRARELFTAQLGRDHLDTLASMNNLAESYRALGWHAEAFKLREETLQLRKAKLGPDHPDTLESMMNLARSYGADGQYAEALKLLKETLQLQKAKLGPDHRRTLRSMDYLALAYASLGRHGEALKLLEESLQLQKAKLGTDHSYTLLSMENLALNYAARGRHAEALKLHEETLQLCKAKLGPDHPQTAKTIYNIACVHALMIPKSKNPTQQTNLAMDWLKKAVSAGSLDVILMKKDTDLDPLRGREDFKKLMTEALKLREETLQLRIADLGPDHPDKLPSMNTLAESYAALGRHAEALKLHEETLQLRKAKLGPDYPDTLTSMNNLASCYAALGRHADALKLYEEALELSKRRADHFIMPSFMYNIACTHAQMIPKSKNPTHQGDLAMDWLKKSVFAHAIVPDSMIEMMKKDESLDPLRGREDFKKLMADLEAEKKATKEE